MASKPKDTSKSSIELRSYKDGLQVDSSIESAHSVPNIQETSNNGEKKEKGAEGPGSTSDNRPEHTGQGQGRSSTQQTSGDLVKGDKKGTPESSMSSSKAKSECTVFEDSDHERDSRQRHQSGPSKIESKSKGQGQGQGQGRGQGRAQGQDAIDRDPESTEQDRMLAGETNADANTEVKVEVEVDVKVADDKLEKVSKPQSQETFGSMLMGFLLAASVLLAVGLIFSVATTCTTNIDKERQTLIGSLPGPHVSCGDWQLYGYHGNVGTGAVTISQEQQQQQQQAEFELTATYIFLSGQTRYWLKSEATVLWTWHWGQCVTVLLICDSSPKNVDLCSPLKVSGTTLTLRVPSDCWMSPGVAGEEGDALVTMTTDSDPLGTPFNSTDLYEDLQFWNLTSTADKPSPFEECFQQF